MRAYRYIALLGIGGTVAGAVGACSDDGGGSMFAVMPGDTTNSVEDGGDGADSGGGVSVMLACNGGDCPASAPACCLDVALFPMALSSSCKPAPCPTTSSSLPFIGGSMQLCATTAECQAGFSCQPLSGLGIASGVPLFCQPVFEGGTTDGAATGACGPGDGLTNCGPGCNESCSTSLTVAAGTYARTYSPVGDGGASAGDPATLSAFRLDKYDVTVGRFRQFVRAVLDGDAGDGGGWLPPAGSGKHTHLNGGLGLLNAGPQFADTTAYETGWSQLDDVKVAPTDANLTVNCDSGGYPTWTASPGANENLPINCVSWYEAYAFCIWDGGFLPSEAEWEYAAAGGDQQLAYPWGSTPPGTGNAYAIYDCLYPGGSTTCRDASNIAAVGAAASGAGRWGQLDLAGNLWQWTLDFRAPYVDPCADCAYLTGTSTRVFRGGSFSSAASALAPTNRGSGPPTLRQPYFGVRCARAP